MRGLELLEVAWRREDDGEFRIETSYLADLPTARLFQETQITPSRLAGALKPRHRLRLQVEDAALYPGPAPRRLKLRRLQRAPLRARRPATPPGASPGLGGRAAGPARGPGVHALRPPGGAGPLPPRGHPRARRAGGRRRPRGGVPGPGGRPGLAGHPQPAHHRPGHHRPGHPAAPEPHRGRRPPVRAPRPGRDGLRLRCLAAFSLPPGGAPGGPRAAHRAARRPDRPAHPPPTPADWRKPPPGCAPPRSTWSASSPPAGAAPGPSSPALAEDAAALAEAGAGATASRLRRVVDATGAPVPDGAQTALPAVSLALAACRQLRARLPGGAPAGAWTPPAPRPTSVRAGATRLLPLARLALEDGEAWACARMRNGWPAEWVLVDPPPPPAPSTPASAAALDPPALAGGGAERPPPVAGPLSPGRRRRSRALRPARAPVPGEGLPVPDGLQSFRRLLSRNGLKDGGAIGGGGDLRFRRLDHAEADAYRWPDRAARDLFAGATNGQVWALVWSGRQESAPIDPLAILVPGRLLRRPALMHLVPGLPTTPL